MTMKFPDELVVCMRAGCSPGHPLTPTFCLDIHHNLELVSNDAVRSARYRMADGGTGEQDATIASLRAELATTKARLDGTALAIPILVESHTKRIVKWLRETGRYDNPWNLDDVADSIERGEHLLHG